MANQPYFDECRLPPRTIIRQMIEEDYENRVLIRTGGGTSKVLHAPRLIQEERPICKSQTQDNEWIIKSLDVYPRRSKDWCRRCLIRMFPERSNLEGAFR